MGLKYSLSGNNKNFYRQLVRLTFVRTFDDTNKYSLYYIMIARRNECFQKQTIIFS